MKKKTWLQMSRLKGFYILFLQERDVTASGFVPKCQKTFKTLRHVIYDASLEGPQMVGNKCGHHFQLLTLGNIVDVLLFSRDIWAYFITSQVKTCGLLAPVTWSSSQTTLMRSWWRRTLRHMKQFLWECWIHSGSMKKNPSVFGHWFKTFITLCLCAKLVKISQILKKCFVKKS